ncbi:MAG: DegV family protein [Tepidanaerobacter sp.]|jgi:DegV family protein with EDD domain|nr:DegV family protein [Tepidanaerobacter sp.]HQA59782.1 DegV family protein [Tepidanaerobacteraceae bacterium]HQE05161.1 DegV family protein [Tepidanaerobacteraceae bacterium]
MKDIVVVTDSSCDLPEEVIDNYPIKVLPMPVSVKENPEMDISGLSIKEFYDAMRRGEILPTTSQVVVSAFMRCFEECINNGQTPLVLGLSSKLTSSFDSALLAKENMKIEDAVIIDTKCASLGLGLVVLKAAKMAKEGSSIQDIAEEIRHYALHMEHIFTVDSLDHLKRGGRISAAQAFVGGLLNIKPILHFVDGAIHPLEKVRGRKNVVKRMVEVMGQRVKNPEKQVVGISHADNEELAMELAEAVKNEFKVKDIMISWIGQVIGAHTGPGAVALFFQNA